MYAHNNHHQKCRNDGVQNMTKSADITFWIRKRSFISTWQKVSSSQLLSWLVLLSCHWSFSILFRPTTAVRWNRWSVDRWSRQGAGRLSSSWLECQTDTNQMSVNCCFHTQVIDLKPQDLLLRHSGQECLCPTSHRKGKQFSSLCWLVDDIWFDGPVVVRL